MFNKDATFSTSEQEKREELIENYRFQILNNIVKHFNESFNELKSQLSIKPIENRHTLYTLQLISEKDQENGKEPFTNSGNFNKIFNILYTIKKNFLKEQIPQNISDSKEKENQEEILKNTIINDKIKQIEQFNLLDVIEENNVGDKEIDFEHINTIKQIFPGITIKSKFQTNKDNPDKLEPIYEIEGNDKKYTSKELYNLYKKITTLFS